MTPEIYGRTERQVRIYRLVKLAILAAATPFAVAAMNRDAPPVRWRNTAMTPLPTVTKDDAMRGDFPVRWATGGRAPLRKIGKHGLFGDGPANSIATIYEGEKAISRARLDDQGRWKAQIRVTDPGVKMLRAEFRRGSVAAGRSAILKATFVDGKIHRGGEVRISNLTQNDRVIAGAFSLRGVAPPGDPVQIYVDATLLGRTEADLAGRWTFRPKLKGGGRRTFTVVDEITEAQFGPLPVFIVPAKAPVTIAATVP